jgi:hypothetical protein
MRGLAELELAFDEFETRRKKADSVRSGNSTHVPTVSAPPQPLTPDEIAERKAGVERARRIMNGAA